MAKISLQNVYREREASMQMIYGTAWKEDRTEGLVSQALETGFRCFDTANQRKHYFEEGLGRALSAAIDAGKVKRSDLFIQTKFTYQRGQDHRLPYDPAAPMVDQVRQSFASSLEHLRTDYLDSYLIHGPERPDFLTKNDWAIWKTMEEFYDAGKVRKIGISNISAGQLDELMVGARVKPSFVQNRCYASILWNRDVRKACLKHGVLYQAFNLVVDPLVWKSPTMEQIANRLGATKAQVMYRFAKQVGMLPMTGTTNESHMREAIAALGLELLDTEIAAIENLAVG